MSGILKASFFISQKQFKNAKAIIVSIDVKISLKKG